MKAMRSAARPEPSQTTTGTGGSSVTYSNTARMVFVPPSITRHTSGIEWVTAKLVWSEMGAWGAKIGALTWIQSLV